ncbi:MAG: helix-turn-helix domain-containing protein [Alphaproteobacteria bacterium]
MLPAGTIDIGAVAERSGLPVSTLRYYEEVGLIRSVGRNGLRRMFDTNVLERLAFIALGRKAGFTLDEISVMFRSGGQPSVDREQLAKKADSLDRTIKQLTAVRDGLRHAAECRAPSHMECPTFQRLMVLATKSEKRTRRAKR